MSLLIRLDPNRPHGLVLESPHGLEISLAPEAPAALAQIRQLLLTQERPKTVTQTPADWHYVLAEWERIGPEGAGKRPRPPLGAADVARRYDASGRVTRPGWNDPLPF